MSVERDFIKTHGLQSMGFGQKLISRATSSMQFLSEYLCTEDAACSRWKSEASRRTSSQSAIVHVASHVDLLLGAVTSRALVMNY